MAAGSKDTPKRKAPWRNVSPTWAATSFSSVPASPGEPDRAPAAPAIASARLATTAARLARLRLNRQALEVSRVVGQQVDPVGRDDDRVGVAQAADRAVVDAGLDREHHAGLDGSRVADVEERRLVVAQADAVPHGPAPVR